MPRAKLGVKAYKAAAAFRSLREQEADVFRRANSALKAARNAATIVRVRALADNRRLWLTIGDLVRDPANPLPSATKAGIISIAMSVHRELDQEAPDFDFLIAINENLTSGLAGHP